jgi:hypothetical protein
MRTLLRSALIVALCVGSAFPTPAQSRTPTPGLLDLLVFWPYFGSDFANGYAPDVKAQIDQYMQRYNSYRSKRPRRDDSGLEKMVQAAWVGYETRLVALSDDPRAPALAAAYVNRLKPCYEWEGFHGCPEREAQFAREYRTANPRGPFSDYLPLLEAHRWLCAAEGYDYEGQPQDAARSRRESNAALAIARKSASPLVRIAAAELAARGRCQAELR